MSAPVIYLMSREQRVVDNKALAHAQRAAHDQGAELLVAFALSVSGRARSREHYQFMLDGLRETFACLNDLGISTKLLVGDSKKNISNLIDKCSPSLMVTDMSPLSGPRSLQSWLSQQVKLDVVDGHNIIPVDVASDHNEFAAHTFRRKVHKHLDTYLGREYELAKSANSKIIKVSDHDWAEAQAAINKTKTSGIKLSYKSGPPAAQIALDRFIDDRLISYALDRNNPNLEGQSNLSPYLHFGQISSLSVARAVIAGAGPGFRPLLLDEPRMASPLDEKNPTIQESANAMLEELIVRRELSDNFCYFSKAGYRTLDACHDWAQQTLSDHKDDVRDYAYSPDQFEAASTHDPAWNAAQRQMMATGKMHGYMRMYWAKKILEWSDSPESAVETAIYLNDFYSIDGGDPNGYAGILWSIGGLHDRAWTERQVYGKIRYMNAAGLARKFKIDDYIDRWTANKLA